MLFLVFDATLIISS